MNRDSNHWSKALKAMYKEYMTRMPDMCYELPKGQSFVFGLEQRFTTTKMNAPKRFAAADTVLVSGFTDMKISYPDKLVVRKNDGTFEIWIKEDTCKKLGDVFEQLTDSESWFYEQHN